MIEFIISSSVLILAILIISSLLEKRINPRIKYALWLLVVVKLLVPVPEFESNISVMNVASSVEDTGVRYLFVDNGSEAKEGSTIGAVAQPEDMAASDKKVSLADICNIVWCAGIVVCAVAFAWSNLRFARNLRRKRKPVGKVKGKLLIYKVPGVTTPCLFGFPKPSIYLQENVELSKEQKRYVLAHEYTHYRQGDHIWAIVRCACVILHWYNPLVWLAARISIKDSELACDAGTLKLVGEGNYVTYGKTLIEIAGRIPKELSGIHVLGCSTGATGGMQEMKKRMRMIVKRPHTRIVTMLILLVLCLGLVGCTFGKAISKEETPSGTVDTNVQDNDQMQEQEYVPTNLVREQKTTMSLVIEGMEEEVSATLYVGDDYSIYVPDEGWQMYAPEAWVSDANEQVQFWIVDYEGETEDSVCERLLSEGYTATDSATEMTKYDEERAVTQEVKIYAYGDKVKAFFFCYPQEAAEGFGIRLQTIANTFAWTGNEGNTDSLYADAAADTGNNADYIKQIEDLILAAETRTEELDENLQNAMTQTDMNIISGEKYENWDTTLNSILDILEENLDEETMGQLWEEQRDWIAEIDEAIELAGEEFGGGSLSILSSNQIAAEMTEERVYELAAYCGITFPEILYEQPEADKVCIQVQPSVYSERISYYYIPTGEEQEWLLERVSMLDLEALPYERRWEGMKESGWHLIYNDLELMAFDGGYLYWQYGDDDGVKEYFIEDGMLYDYIQIMLQEELDYQQFDPAQIENIVSAKLEVGGAPTGYEVYSQTITDEESLDLMEDWFSSAEYIFGGAGCGYACLELTLEGGRTVNLSVATDSCTNFAINGVYYEYTPTPNKDNMEFFHLFDEIPWEY